MKWQYISSLYRSTDVCALIHCRSSSHICILIPKLLEIEKESVREVARGDKHYLRKSADCKSQISKVLIQLSGLICALRSADFLR